MDAKLSSRLLSIGEFAAATQLSPKALRLYDEQGVLRPAVVEAANGYRYYHDQQIALGRLVRTLRDMELPLAAVADVLNATDVSHAQALVRRYADEGERRIARQRRACQAALALLHTGSMAQAPAVIERERSATTVAIRAFVAERRTLVKRFQEELAAGYAALADVGVMAVGEPLCLLIDPLSDDEGRLELAIPVVVSQAMPAGCTIRGLAARRCAVLAVNGADADALDLAGAMDSIFDWFDRRGHHAAEAPSILFTAGDARIGVELLWPFEPAGSAFLTR